VARRAKLVAQGIALGLVALLFVLLAWTLLTEEGGDLAKKAARGERPQAPDFTLERLDQDGELTLSSLEGKAVVLNVWASWCIPCKDEAPFLEQVWQQNRDRDVVVVGLDAKDFRSDARRFMKRFGLTFPIVYDGPGDSLGGYGVTGFPETFVIDRDRKVVEVFAGAVNAKEDRARLRRAIEQARSS
jgi:cytochrome c biogenesis protein CcmG/thiol:disulfide interchange protein DsbE